MNCVIMCESAIEQFVQSTVSDYVFSSYFAPEASRTTASPGTVLIGQLAAKAPADGETRPGIDRKPERESLSISIPTNEDHDVFVYRGSI